MREIDSEFRRKYSRISKLASREFPDDEWYMDITVWDDDSFVITAEHNRTDGETGRWCCRIIIGSGNSSTPSVEQRDVLYSNLTISESNYIAWHEENKHYLVNKQNNDGDCE